MQTAVFGLRFPVENSRLLQLMLGGNGLISAQFWPHGRACYLSYMTDDHPRVFFLFVIGAGNSKKVALSQVFEATFWVQALGSKGNLYSEKSTMELHGVSLWKFCIDVIGYWQVLETFRF